MRCYLGLALACMLAQPGDGLGQGRPLGGIGSTWSDIRTYGSMQCWQLQLERDHVLRDLRLAQLPANFENNKWSEARNRYQLLNKLYGDRCVRLSEEDREEPPPPRVDLLPEKDLVDAAARAIRSGRLRAAEALLLQGSAAGYPNAQFDLGMYYHLLGRREDSRRWLRSAAALGHPDASGMLKTLETTGK